VKAAIFNPYLDTLGGGERYTLAFAKVLKDHGWEVYLQWGSGGILKKLEDRFGYDLQAINVVSDVKRGSGYDLCFWVSDGSIPILSSRKNILHFQFPFHNVEGKSLINKMKFFKVNHIVCNSKFTKKVIDDEYGVKSKVIYPPIDTKKIRAKRKEKIILYVGRFSQLAQSKRQDVLVKCFKKLVKSGKYPNWKLVLAGGTEVGADLYVKQLTKGIKGYPIEIIKSPDYKTITNLYGKAKFFWSAAGLGENEKKHPEKVEHFGITTVEAMSAGDVPIVYNAGGQREIIRDGKNGFLWKKENELVKLTKVLIDDNKLRNRISKGAMDSSHKYSYERFEKEVSAII